MNNRQFFWLGKAKKSCLAEFFSQNTEFSLPLSLSCSVFAQQMYTISSTLFKPAHVTYNKELRLLILFFSPYFFSFSLANMHVYIYIL